MKTYDIISNPLFADADTAAQWLPTTTEATLEN